jgi:hypothetical protein
MQFLSTQKHSLKTEDMPALWALLLHDIISPASGLISAISLLGDITQDDAHSLSKILNEGGQSLRAHLDYLRLGFASVDDCSTPHEQLKHVVIAYFATKKHITLTWTGHHDENTVPFASAVTQTLFWMTKTHAKLRNIDVHWSDGCVQISCNALPADTCNPLYETLGAYIRTYLTSKALNVTKHIQGAGVIYTLQKSAPET